MRRTCMDCVRKHIAQAIVLFDEAKGRYPSHFWLAVGHLAEAEAESMDQFPDYAKKLRGIRWDLIKGSEEKYYLLDLIDEATALYENAKGCNGCNYN